MLVLQSFSFLNISHISPDFWSRLRSSHFGHRRVVLIIFPQNVLHKVSTTFLLHLRSTVDSFHRGEGLKQALIAVGKVDDRYHICPPLSSISIECSGQRPLWKKSSRSYNLPKPFGTLKSRKTFQKIGSKWTNQKVTKFPERSATLRNFVGFRIFVGKPLFLFLSFIGPFMTKGAILCSQLMFWLVNFVRSGPVQVVAL